MTDTTYRKDPPAVAQLTPNQYAVTQQDATGACVPQRVLGQPTDDGIYVDIVSGEPLSRPRTSSTAEAAGRASPGRSSPRTSGSATTGRSDAAHRGPLGERRQPPGTCSTTALSRTCGMRATASTAIQPRPGDGHAVGAPAALSDGLLKPGLISPRSLSRRRKMCDVSSEPARPRQACTWG